MIIRSKEYKVVRKLDRGRLMLSKDLRDSIGIVDGEEVEIRIVNIKDKENVAKMALMITKKED